jgi:hypothetical protein
VAVVVALVVPSLLQSPATPGGTGPRIGEPAAQTQFKAATALSGLLSQSAGAHADVNAAVADVDACGPNLAKDPQVFNRAAADRRTLLTRLAELPGRSTLSPVMIADLNGAWQTSATLDTDLAKWAQDEVGDCKEADVDDDPNYTATLPLDSQATGDKTAFVKLWNPLGQKDALPTWQPAQL